MEIFVRVRGTSKLVGECGGPFKPCEALHWLDVSKMKV